jgi:hypothetical protein
MAGQTNPTVERVAGRLHHIFDDLIVVSDEETGDLTKKEQLFRTRAYMALALLDVSDANASEAASSITDGGADGGVDCVYVSEKQKKIFLGQAKFASNISNGPSLAEFNRFRDGVRSVVNQEWTATNANLHPHKDKVERLLKDIDTTIFMLFAYNSEQDLSVHVKESRDKFLSEMNKFEQFVEFEEFRLERGAQIARTRARPENIDVQIMLRSWGLRRDPYKAVYGAVPAADVVRIYNDYSHRLFSENLRFGIEKSEVNDGIRETARENPEHFWYFNNGITAICEEFRKLPAGGQSTETGVFEVKRISIINGAQTVSSLARAVAEGSDISTAEVHMRIISLDDTPEDFSTEITTANNTQNDLSPVDFVAADQNQDRLRREAAGFGKVYSYRRGEIEPRPEDGFTVREATIAAACASGDLRLAVSAKRYISGLWENTTREPYTRLFNDETTAIQLWNAVQILRFVDRTLAVESKALEGRARLVSVHANRFILFTVFDELALDLATVEISVADTSSKIEDITKRNLAVVVALVEDLFPEGYPGNLFKNQERQSEILTELKKTLSAPA